jgi:hypothetical protein
MAQRITCIIFLSLHPVAFDRTEQFDLYLHLYEYFDLFLICIVI